MVWGQDEKILFIYKLPQGGGWTPPFKIPGSAPAPDFYYESCPATLSGGQSFFKYTKKINEDNYKILSLVVQIMIVNLFKAHGYMGIELCF